MLLSLDYTVYYTENAQLPPPTIAYILLYISVYTAIYSFLRHFVSSIKVIEGSAFRYIPYRQID